MEKTRKEFKHKFSKYLLENIFRNGTNIIRAKGTMIAHFLWNIAITMCAMFDDCNKGFHVALIENLKTLQVKLFFFVENR